jgi:hypothetical protein
MPENSRNIDYAADSDAHAKKQAILIKNMQHLRAMHLSYVKEQLLRNGTRQPPVDAPALPERPLDTQ